MCSVNTLTMALVVCWSQIQKKIHKIVTMLEQLTVLEDGYTKDASCDCHVLDNLFYLPSKTYVRRLPDDRVGLVLVCCRVGGVQHLAEICHDVVAGTTRSMLTNAPGSNGCGISGCFFRRVRSCLLLGTAMGAAHLNFRARSPRGVLGQRTAGAVSLEMTWGWGRRCRLSRSSTGF